MLIRLSENFLNNWEIINLRTKILDVIDDGKPYQESKIVKAKKAKTLAPAKNKLFDKFAKQ